MNKILYLALFLLNCGSEPSIKQGNYIVSLTVEKSTDPFLTVGKEVPPVLWAIRYDSGTDTYNLFTNGLTFKGAETSRGTVNFHLEEVNSEKCSLSAFLTIDLQSTKVDGKVHITGFASQSYLLCYAENLSEGTFLYEDWVTLFSVHGEKEK